MTIHITGEFFYIVCVLLSQINNETCRTCNVLRASLVFFSFHIVHDETKKGAIQKRLPRENQRRGAHDPPLCVTEGNALSLA